MIYDQMEFLNVKLAKKKKNIISYVVEFNQLIELYAFECSSMDFFWHSVPLFLYILLDILLLINEKNNIAGATKKNTDTFAKSMVMGERNKWM